MTNAHTTKEVMLLVSTGKKLTAVWSDEIMYLTSDSGYAVLMCNHGKRYVSSKSLLELLVLLPMELFIPINRSVVVNKRYISCVENGMVNILTMTNGEEFKISRRRKADFYAQMIRV